MLTIGSLRKDWLLLEGSGCRFSFWVGNSEV
jgi:hypothetical protein